MTEDKTKFYENMNVVEERKQAIRDSQSYSDRIQKASEELEGRKKLIHYMIDLESTACGKDKIKSRCYNKKFRTTKNINRVSCPACKDEMGILEELK